MRTIRNCNVAVVGGAGFLGSHLVDHLIDDRSCRVAVIDNLVAGRREFVHPKARLIHHDITGSEDFLRHVFRMGQIKFVLNYAAYPYVPDSYDRPLHVFAVNANGAMKVINAAQEAGCVEAILQVSSAEIYGDPGQVPNYESKYVDAISEDAPCRPHSTYGCAKAAIDSWVQCRWWEAKTPCIALRQFNCVGERETHPYVIPEIISQLYRGDGTNIRLGNDSHRDFMYAGDAVRIAVELLERGQFGGVYNLGSEESIGIYDLARLIAKVNGNGTVKIEADPDRMRRWEIWHLQSDNSKVKSLYAPLEDRMGGLVPLEESLRRTIQWFRDNGCKWPWEQ